MKFTVDTENDDGVRARVSTEQRGKTVVCPIHVVFFFASFSPI